MKVTPVTGNVIESVEFLSFCEKFYVFLHAATPF